MELHNLPFTILPSYLNPDLSAKLDVALSMRQRLTQWPGYTLWIVRPRPSSPQTGALPPNPSLPKEASSFDTTPLSKMTTSSAPALSDATLCMLWSEARLLIMECQYEGLFVCVLFFYSVGPFHSRLFILFISL